MSEQDEAVVRGAGVVLLVLIVLAVGLMAGLPIYNKWRKEVSGEAELAKARSTKLVQIEEARANLDSEKLNAQAEVERAKGMAEAMEIENGQLTDRYIKYLMIRQQRPGANSTERVYIPTEAGLPILEAGR